MTKNWKVDARSLWIALPIAVAAIVAGAPRTAAAGPSKDEEAVKARVAEFIALFDKGDSKGMAGFWADDATLVNPAGQSGKGPVEIEKLIAHDLATILQGARMEMKVVQFRPIGKDAAWVELEHSVAGAKGPDGKAMPPMTFHVPSLMLRKGKTWVIAEARPYAYLPPMPPAASAAAGGAPAMAGAPAAAKK